MHTDQIPPDYLPLSVPGLPTLYGPNSAWRVWLAALPLDASNAWIMAGMFLAGVGFGLFQTPNNRAMLGAAPRQRSGAAGGLQATTRVFGQSFGTALVAVAFGVIPSQGPAVALVLAAVCAAAAVAVNTVRSARAA